VGWLGPAGSSNFLPVRLCDIAVIVSAQETPISKKRRGPAPTGLGTPVLVRLQPDALAKLDAFMVAYGIKTRPAGVRALLDRGFETSRGERAWAELDRLKAEAKD
jgi:hypothetical protein